VETGSTATASATNLTHTDQGFRYTAQLGLYEWDIYRDSYVLCSFDNLRHWKNRGQSHAEVYDDPRNADMPRLTEKVRGSKSDRSTEGNPSNCVRATDRKGCEITLIVASTLRRNGRYVAHLGEKGQPLCVSTKPFLDAARRLIALGFGPGISLVMRHSGSDTVCLRATIGTAAALTVEDTQYGPRFRPWKPISTQAVSRRIAS
jgi:hypothetical protein